MWPHTSILAASLLTPPPPSYPQLISEVRDKLDTKSCFFHLELGLPVASSTPLPQHSKQ